MKNNENTSRRSRRNRTKRRKSKRVFKTIYVILGVVFAATVIFVVMYQLTTNKGLATAPKDNTGNNAEITEKANVDKSETDADEDSSEEKVAVDTEVNNQTEQNLNKNNESKQSSGEKTLKVVEKQKMSAEEYVIYKNYINNSSTCLTDNGKAYPADLINDFKNDTAWNEGANGDGIGEWVEIQFEAPQKINAMVIQNGYKKSKDLYYENNRPKMLKIDVIGQQSFMVNLEDVYNNGFYIEFPETMETYGVTITIEDVYNGTKFNDTCISEVQLVYKK